MAFEALINPLEMEDKFERQKTFVTDKPNVHPIIEEILIEYPICPPVKGQIFRSSTLQQIEIEMEIIDEASYEGTAMGTQLEVCLEVVMVQAVMEQIQMEALEEKMVEEHGSEIKEI